jgi:glycosyltransferase involved in cell wall biosynthesis
MGGSIYRTLTRSTAPIRTCLMSPFQIIKGSPCPLCIGPATIHHGLPPDLYPFNAQGGQYLVFLGRIAPEKRPDRAIEIAKRAGVPLKIAAKVDHVDQEYFKCEIEPLLDDPLT